MGWFNLPRAKYGVPDAWIDKKEFAGRAYIVLALDVIALGFRYQKSVFQVFYVIRDGGLRNTLVRSAHESLGNLMGMERGPSEEHKTLVMFLRELFVLRWFLSMMSLR